MSTSLREWRGTVGEVIGPYRLSALIGRGSSGEVWLARDTRSPHRSVAVKRLAGGPQAADPAGTSEAIDRLRHEADVLANLAHPSLVPLLDVVPDPPGVALVMAHLAGGSLRGLLDERGTIGAGQLVAVITPVAGALSALQRAGLVHGDVKPDNVLLTGEGEPVLADVGVARAWGRDAGATVPGTPAYLDPALVAGRPVAPTSDVFALGVVAYEALTGRLPHRGEPAEVLAAAAAGVRRPLRSWPTIPVEVADVVEAALDPDPDRRPADATAFADRLRCAVEPTSVVLPGPARRTGPQPPEVGSAAAGTVGFGTRPGADVAGRRWPKRRTVGVAVGAVAVVAGVVVAGVGIAGIVAPAGDRPGPVPGTARGGSGAPASCPSSLPSPGAGPVEWADVDGDRCTDLIRRAGNVVQVTTAAGSRTYRIAGTGPNDQVLLGDWDGDGRVSPAIYRSASGELQYLDRLPDRVGEQVVAGRTDHLRAGGSARVEHGPPDQVRVVDR